MGHQTVVVVRIHRGVDVTGPPCLLKESDVEAEKAAEATRAGVQTRSVKNFVTETAKDE